jgi:hypothetical protein
MPAAPNGANLMPDRYVHAKELLGGISRSVYDVKGKTR